ncbi:MAG: hypothetical protein ABSG53_31710 [Thermoguttaceae bacterium]
MSSRLITEVESTGQIVAWCKAMTKADGVGFIYDRKIAALQEHANASQS